ncbi:hypothetical protein SAMN02745885_00546 [Carboxydocella sporoproducens DSM 16521]|uniref:Uncharacterized protein n=2 Tax=Carboxydocella TaxID=178898 RepID=A0A1T4MFG5_9FIRM|nr:MULTISPECIES: hypothetical protein [Carboxydocella]AVX21302.1 hypothetical protein CFE_2139 [Carboxydocella thermautotrophica]AVX31733.1 hypothetical protein CTH_2171 [Carboxydocella thermautotrophica]SJZ65528.1 hypothetical protein SAMN02745885_00546 [Carboxydocella sporoproducens DSM 16521]
MLLPEMRELVIHEQAGKPPWKRLEEADREKIRGLLQQAWQEGKGIRIIYYWQGQAKELLFSSFRLQGGVLEGVTPQSRIRRLRERYIIEVQLVDWEW